jgi:hypothetical protein
VLRQQIDARGRLALVALSAALAAGCNGGTVDRHAATRDGETLDSIACEGAIVADGVRRGRTVRPFVEVQSEALRLQASNLADALGSRDVAAGLEARVRAEARRAARQARLLERLHDHPGDRRIAAAVRRQLRRLGNCR